MTNEKERLIDGLYKFADLIDVGRLKTLFDGFSKTTGLSTTITSQPDQKLIVATGWRRVCSDFHRSGGEWSILCRDCNYRIASELKAGKTNWLGDCDRGLMLGATPIIIRGTHCANLFAGQVFFEAPDLERYRTEAVKLGYDVDSYLKAIADVPVVERGKLENALSFLGNMAGLIAEQGLNKLISLETVKRSRYVEESVRTTLNSIGDAVIATDKDGRVRRMNDIAERLTGWTRQEALDRLLSEVFRIVNAKTRKTADNPVERALSTGEIVGLANHTLLISRDGREYQIADSAAPIRDDSGVITGVVLVFRDVSDEYQLRAERERTLTLLNTVIEQSPLGIIISGTDGQIIEVNPKMVEILGSPSADATKQMNVLSYSPLVKIGYSDALKQCATRKETVVFETTYTSKWKKDVIVQAHIAPLLDSDGNVEKLLTLAEDITDRKRAEETVKKNHAAMLAVFDGIDEPIYVSDMKTYEVIFINRALRDTFGPSGNRKCYEHFQGRTSPCPFCTNAIISSDEYEGRSYVWEFQNEVSGHWYRCIDKAILWPDGRTVRYEMAFDITDRKRAEEELRRNAAFTNALLDSIPTPVYYKNINGEYHGCNRAFTEMTGLSANDIKNKTAADIWPGEQAAVYESKRLEFLKESQPMTYETVILDKTGALRPVMITNDSYRDDSGEIAGMIGIVLDISEHKKTEDAMRVARDRITRQRAAIASLATDEFITSGDLTAAARSIALLASETLDVKRVSVWLLSADQSELVCIAHSDNDAVRPSVGLRLLSADYPRYFDAIKTESRISARDVQNDIRTREFTDSYLRPLGITSMLDVSIMVGGTLRGILCVEHIGEMREWLSDEESFAGAVAALVGQGIANSERRRAEEALRHSEERFRDLVDLLPEAVFETDLTMRITYANRRAMDLFGYEPEDMLTGVNALDIILPEDRKEIADRFARRLRNEPTGVVEFITQRKDGSVLPVLFHTAPIIKNGKPSGIRGIIIDNTERKKAEEIRQNYISFLENMGYIDTAVSNQSDIDAMLNEVLSAILVIYKCDRSWLVYPCDPSADHWSVQMLCAVPEFEEAIPTGELIPMSSEAVDVLRLVLDAKKPVVEDPASGIPLDSFARGNRVQSQMLLAIYPKLGAPWMLGVHQCSYERVWTLHEQNMFHEIGRRIADGLSTLLYYRSLQENNVKLARINEELESFTYSVSHDLKSPVITIKAFAGLLSNGLKAGKIMTMSEDLERIAKAADKMFLMLEEILTLSRVGRVSDERITVSFNDIVAEALENVAGQILERGIEVAVENNMPVVSGDRRRLVEMAQNLLDNAIKYIGQPARPAISVGSGVHRGLSAFYVKDNGIGIAQEYHAKVFRLFDVLDPNHSGSGVGLALVKKIIQAHNGEIWIESEGNNKGTTFWFTLPK